ncbi:hypothetical protein [Tepidibacter hydrothermalis]|uniref:Uncharacterized protein n=1 Tax=Tepidibacter hydrothermalis TaxID=3036126 RepID=A0ABY8EHR5_9FIRM|nr:hypothetical protein [Tepidibacter hydrothermalis]WFD11309.1 hypothetical protein P4S50_04325 [Tepidibacter hydrothermalis]
MKYTKFIQANEGFQYAINLQYDISNLSKVKSYIPTKQSVDILKKYLLNIYYDKNDRSTILVGPYGKGKSHLLLILLSLLSFNIQNTEELGVINELIEKIKRIDEQAANICEELVKRENKFLPVIINSNYVDLNQAFLIALKNALKTFGIDDIFPNTYFDSIKKIIDVWSTDYKDAINIFEQELENYNLNIDKFINKLNSFDQQAYEIFTKIYPKISSGAEFNPLINADIVKLYSDINYIITEKYGFKGIFVVFDEFSKFLEAGVTKNVSKDIKILQDFAELANRSSNSQLYITCITHKAINEYIARLPKSSIDAWRAIEGRFNEIYFTSSSQQNYELISNTIIKDDEKFNKFIKQNIEKFKNKLDKSFRIFQDIFSYKEYENIIGLGCYPLNPLTSYILPKVSEKVAQNERTLFTFLSKNELGSLVNFINKNEGSLKFLGIDSIYDYFQILFRKEVFNQNIYNGWLKANNTMQKVSSEVEKNIVKAIAIIYIINELDKLAPIDEIIKLALDISDEEYKNAIESLLNKNILSKKKSNLFYRFTSSRESNVKEEITKIKNIKIKKINYAIQLSDLINLGYTLPRRYNDEYSMVRFFKKIFITTEQFLAYDEAKLLINEYKSDGLILNLIYLNQEEKQQAIEKIKELNNDRILLCIPNSPFDKEEELKEYTAVQYLKEDKQFLLEDEYALQELQIYEEDLVDCLNNYVKNGFNIEYENCYYYTINGIDKTIKKLSHLNRRISEICEEIFDKTPKINNELINKNNISSPINKARNKIIDYILSGMDGNSDYALKGNGPEVTIYRIAVKNKGLENSLISNDANLNYALNTIKEFILAAEENRISFSKLYEMLQDEEYGFGIRKGVIPIYLALVIKEFKEDIVIYFGDKKSKEISLTSQSLTNINESFENHYLLLEKGSNEKEDYINSFENLFKEYMPNKKIMSNRYVDIINAMQVWFNSLSKYTRVYFEDIINNNEVSKDIIELRKELCKFDINPREFLFDRIKNKILRKTTLKKCFARMLEIKNKLDNHIFNVKNHLILETREVFNKEYQGSLGQALKNWYDDLKETNKKYSYNIEANNILEFIQNLNTNNEIDIVSKMAYIVTGLNIEDWKDETYLKYKEEIQKIYKDVSEDKEEIQKVYDEVYECEDEIAMTSVELYKVVKVQNGKLAKEKNFKGKDISPIGETLLNQMEELFEEYGESIEVNEKRNILMQILQKYM